MALYIGLDDTDGEKRMCTTYVATELIRKLTENYDLVGHPRLVRLNPNIPWKTRGNGALSISIGKGYGDRFLIGSFGNKKIYGYENGRSIKDDNGILKIVKEIVEENAAFEDPKTNPAFVITNNRPPRALYRNAVQGIVQLKDARKLARKIGARYKSYKNGRGLIGALAAVAWTPKDMTDEILVYREMNRWGTSRKVSKKDVMKLDMMFTSTFNNYDHENHKAAIVPNSPCPILFGIRGDEMDELVPAMKAVTSERKERWFLFETNQATDDHLVRRSIRDVRSFESVMTKGKVLKAPRTITGGHVIFSLEAQGDTMEVAAYEPTKGFRGVIRMLAPGDDITVYGGVREKPKTVNIEKIRIDKLTRLQEKVANPMCGKCNKRMKSVGKGKGYRCIRCGARSNRPEMRLLKRKLERKFYEPPVCARRHLSKPLKRMTGS